MKRLGINKGFVSMPISYIQFILYVEDQSRSKDFYRRVLMAEPCLDVHGMTEFILSDTVKLGLMPESGIAKILTGKMPHPGNGNGIPRCELYLKVDMPEEYIKRAIAAGAREISPFSKRDWGDLAAYLSDPDGHVIAFASTQ